MVRVMSDYHKKMMIIVSISYLLCGFKSFPADESILYMWLGLGGLACYFYTSRNKAV